jgi:hypothetical protein
MAGNEDAFGHEKSVFKIAVNWQCYYKLNEFWQRLLWHPAEVAEVAEVADWSDLMD